MSARTQLNATYGYGSLFLAAVVGACANSWWAFAVALAGLLVLNIHAGKIRLTPRPRYRPADARTPPLTGGDAGCR